MIRLMEEPALKRLKEKTTSLEHFKVDQATNVMTVVKEKPIEEYTLPHPIWSQVESFDIYALSNSHALFQNYLILSYTKV